MDTLLPALFFLFALGPIFGALLLSRAPKHVAPLRIREITKR